MMVLKVCVDEKDQVTFEGRVHSLVDESIEFYNFQDLIVKIDKFLDAFGHPQSSIDKRSMRQAGSKGNAYAYPNEGVQPLSSLDNVKGERSTFTLYIQTRSRGDWQGRVSIEEQPFTDFNSILELMNIVTK